MTAARAPRILDGMPAITVVVVETQAVLADALATALGLEVDIEVVHAGTSLERAEAVVGLLDADVTVVDLDAQGALTTIQRLHESWPAMGIVGICDQADARLVADALRCGVRGIARRSESVGRLVAIVHGVAAGEAWVPPRLLRLLIDELLTQPEERSPEAALMARLTPRERDVLDHLVEGRSRPEIARLMYVSPNTVRTHVNNVLRKLGVHSSVAAVALARRARQRTPSAA